ncbi:aldo/keto reductase [Streptomyces katrae]|uniref:Aldo/keto reductase n=1 Tax=Streptomyces katrae TaxID=68223 RepID=A0A0F4JVT9_9ACTN|nr:aldo/keto reductase [Streptomyces katrae]KJY37086.1 aldo/keto reductase [Streptomyces katrae]
MTTELALGTYHCRDIPRAAAHAVARGAHWIDTAPNYRAGRAHTQLAAVLTQHPQVKVSTKTGFFGKDEATAAVAEGILTWHQAAAGHSLTPEFLRWQTSRSLDLLGRADLVFVHNPEHARLDRKELHQRLREAFIVLEDFAHTGRIGGYGVATWSGLDTAEFSVTELLALAREAAGGHHHLHAVQLPVSLVMARPISLALDGRGPLVQARAAGLDVFASSPLHGGQLPGMVTAELAEVIEPGLTPTQAALRIVASTPGVTRVLLGTSNPAHWDAAQQTLALDPLPPSTLRKVLDVLGT